MTRLFFGADPETFIVDEKNEPVPGWKFFGDKHTESSGVFRDGFAVEINPQPSYCRELLWTYSWSKLRYAHTRIPKGYRLLNTPTMPVDLKKILRGCPKDALVFGCDPAWNAYTMEYEGTPLDATEHAERYAGGHMHISPEGGEHDAKIYGPNGYEWMLDEHEVARYIRMLDRYLLPLTAVWFAKPETFRRRRYYGKAGEFRLQRYPNRSYGVEYRTPGPEGWNSPVVLSFAYGVMRAVAQNYVKLSKEKEDKGLMRDIRHAVNTGDGAEALLRRCYMPFSGTNYADFKKIVRDIRPFQQQIPMVKDDLYLFADHGTSGWDFFVNNCKSDEKKYLSYIEYSGIVTHVVREPASTLSRVAVRR